MRSLIAAAILLGTALSAQTQEPQRKPRPYSVCETLAQRLVLHGKLIRIRAKVQGAEEWVALHDPTCTEKIRVAGVDLPASIVLEPLPASGYSLNGRTIHEDQPELARFEQVLAEKVKSTGSAEGLWVVYEGIFETKRELLTYDAGGGVRRADGFGHMGGFLSRFMIVRPIGFEVGLAVGK